MYKILTNYGNTSSFWDSCRQTAGAPLDEIYRCCKSKCAKSEICEALCSNVYQGTIMEDCAYNSGCWISGSFDPQCVRARQDAIQPCCQRACRQGQYSSIKSIKEARAPTAPFDCNDYCSNYVIP